MVWTPQAFLKVHKWAALGCISKKLAVYPRHRGTHRALLLWGFSHLAWKAFHFKIETDLKFLKAWPFFFSILDQLRLKLEGIKKELRTISKLLLKNTFLNCCAEHSANAFSLLCSHWSLGTWNLSAWDGINQCVSFLLLAY